MKNSYVDIWNDLHKDFAKNNKPKYDEWLDEFPFEDNSTDLVIADLSLHYFKEKDTNRIISEIKRILKPNGYLFFRLNSTNSTEYKKIIEHGEKEIESNLFFSKNMEK